jgi:DNA-binding CsgD family transcriptional regulator/methylmalonyl-CoA mutase cobalamin-binding subunit
MSDCLAAIGEDWAQGRGPVLAERTASHAAAAVASRLLAAAPAPTSCGTVVLATPPGDRHTLALTTLAHLLQAAGHPVLVVDDLPLAELAQLASSPGTAAVVLSAHASLSVVTARQLLSALRRAAPQVFLAIGGPGFPRATSAAADLVTNDVELLLKELDARSSVLTSREREVLLGVADGLTNAEIALHLGLSPSTVKTHLDHVFSKTRTEHRAAAVARALRQGWLR